LAEDADVGPVVEAGGVEDVEAFVVEEAGEGIGGEIPKVSGGAEVFPVITGELGLDVGDAGADGEEVAAGFKDLMDFADGGVEIVDVFDDVEGDDEVEGFVFEVLGLDIADAGVEAEGAGVSGAGFGEVEAGGFEAGIILDVLEEVALATTDFEEANFLITGEVSFDPGFEELVFQVAPETAFGFEDFVFGVGAGVSAGEVFFGGEVAGEDKAAALASDDIVIVLVLPEVMLGALADGAYFEEGMVFEGHE
jgi:hypothetical protein